MQTDFERGIAFVKNEKFAEAKDHFKKAIAIKPTPTAWTYLGVTAERTGDRTGAEEAYKSALKLDVGFTEAAQNLSALYLDDPARPDDAIALLGAALEKNKDKDSVKLLMNLGYAHGLKGNVEAANKAYEAALAKGEDLGDRFAWGAMLHEQKQSEKAAQQLKRAVDGANEDVALLVSAGRLRRHQGLRRLREGVRQGHRDCRATPSWARPPRHLQARAQGRGGRAEGLRGGY